MKDKNSKLIIFSIGAAGYGLLEILWRGYTHWSMVIAGGLCFSFFGVLGEKMRKASLILKGIAGGVFITAVEFLFGIIFNIILKKKVWDYSKMPFNIGGQICLFYSVLWVCISIICIPFAYFLKKKLNSKGKCQNELSSQNLGRN